MNDAAVSRAMTLDALLDQELELMEKLAKTRDLIAQKTDEYAKKRAALTPQKPSKAKELSV